MNEKLKGLINSSDFSGGSLAFHALQPQIEIEWLNGCALPRVESFVIGDPLAPAGESVSHPDPLDIRRHYPHLSFVHIGAGFARSLKGAGYNIAALGCEALVDLPFSLIGPKKSDLRRALNQSLKAGVHVREVSERDFPTLAREIELANSKWLENRPLYRREFRYMARPFVDRFQAGERRFVAFQNGKAIGLAVYDPILSNGCPDGYLETIIRGYPASPTGVRDLLTITALNQFTTEGVSLVSLGLCPFHSQPDISKLANCRLTGLALKLFYRFCGQIFNCRGLAFHKSRYRPRFKTVYFATLSRFTLIELYRICRLSNIDALYPFLRLYDNFRLRLMRQLFRKRPEQSAL